jgi:hypothetical protein
MAAAICASVSAPRPAKSNSISLEGWASASCGIGSKESARARCAALRQEGEQ